MRILNRRGRIAVEAGGDPGGRVGGRAAGAGARGDADLRCSDCPSPWPSPDSAATRWLAERSSRWRRMTDRARSITADRLADRLPVENPDDEMGRLAAVFNETLGRLQRSFEQMRQFTSDVSHELRTPLTSIRSVGEVGLRGHRDEAGLSHHHRQHARGGRSPGGSRRPAADAVARRDRTGAAVARGRGPSGAGRERRVTPQRAGRGEAAADRRRTDGGALGPRRSPGAAAGAHQPGGQRDQVHAGRRIGARAPVGDARGKRCAT